MINAEAFELIEQRKEEGVTASYLAERLGITKQSAASWLSTWTRRGYLKFIRYEGSPNHQIEELERIERIGVLGREEEQRLKDLRAWRIRVHSMQDVNRGKAGRPPQGKYVLGPREWNAYARGKFEERIAMRGDVERW